MTEGVTLLRACGRCGAPGPMRTPCPCLRSDDRRPERLEQRRFYWSRRWRAFRAAVLRRRPLCEDCLAQGFTTPAMELHHIEDPRVAPALAYADSNVMPLCKSCHSRRTRRGQIARVA